MSARLHTLQAKDKAGTRGNTKGSSKKKRISYQRDRRPKWTGQEIGLPTLRAFPYGASEVRAVEKDGKAWFVAQDVCDVLGIINARQTLERLDESEKGVSKVYTLARRIPECLERHVGRHKSGADVDVQRPKSNSARRGRRGWRDRKPVANGRRELADAISAEAATTCEAT